MRAVVIGPTTHTERGIEEIIKHCDIPAVFTLPEAQRAGKVRVTDFAKSREQHSFALHTGDLKDPATHDKIHQYKPDVIFVLGESRIIPEKILSIPEYGCIGSHGGPLPKVKGGATLNWAVLLGEERWGVSLFYLTKAIDEGSIVGVEYFDILPNDDINMVNTRSDMAIAKLLGQTIPQLQNGSLETIDNIPAEKPFPKRGKEETLGETIARNNEMYRIWEANKGRPSVYIPGRKPVDGVIDWRRTTKQVYDAIRAQTQPFNGAYGLMHGKPVKIWQASPKNYDQEKSPGEIVDVINGLGMLVGTGDGSILLTRMQANDQSALPADVCFAQNKTSWKSKFYVPEKN